MATMYISHPTQPGFRSDAALTQLSLDQRVLASRARARRRWVIQSGLMLCLTAGMLILFVVWQRDQATLDQQFRMLDKPAAHLQAAVNQLGVLPALPPVEQGLDYYANDAERFYAVNSGQPAIIAVSSRVPLLLREDGRCVLIYHEGKITRQWMTLAQFLNAWNAQERDREAFEEQRRSHPPVLP